MAHATAASDAIRSTAKQLGTVGGLTLLSRLTGLARDMVIAHTLGTRAAADAFYVAFRIPNLMRRLFAEGEFTMAFLPTYADYRSQSPDEARRAADTIFTGLLCFLIALVTLGVLAAPALVMVTASGFSGDPEKFALTVTLSRIMFPYLGLVSVMALCAGLLNSWRYFVTPAFAPVLLNVWMVIGAVWFARWFAEPTYGMALGVLCGGVWQLGIQVPPLLKRGILPRLTWPLTHASLRQMVRIMLPAVYGGAVYQINVLMITQIASFLPVGSVSFLWYADRITEFPLGIFAVAVATVTLPNLAEQYANGALDDVRRLANASFRTVLAITIPATIGLQVLARPIVRLLFESGAFTAHSTDGTVGALIFFGLGIPFVSLVRNIVPVFYAIKDVKTPVRIATMTILTNALFALMFIRFWQHRGLAAAMMVTNMLYCSVLLWMLAKRLRGIGARQLFTSALRSTVAAGFMGVAVWGAGVGLQLTTTTGRLPLLWRVFACMAVGLISYAAALRVCNPGEWQLVERALRRR